MKSINSDIMSKVQLPEKPIDQIFQNPKPKFSWERLALLVSVVLLTASVVGGSSWYVMSQFIQVRNDEIASLKGRIENLERRLSGKEAPKETGVSEEATDETADWKTYTDNTNNYSIKYPSDWIYKEIVDTGSVNFSKNNQSFVISVINNTKKLTVDEYVTEIGNSFVRNKTNIRFGVNSGISFLDDTEETVNKTYVFLNDNNGVIIIVKTEFKDAVNTLEKMLLTLDIK